jgi:hypothetical protein
MGYTAPTTLPSGYFVTPTEWNRDIVDNVTFLANPPACRVYKSTSMAIAHNTLTVCTFDTERYDTDSMHSTSADTSRITINTPGLYLITAHMVWQADTDYTRRLMDILLGGATILARKSDESPAHAVANDEGWNLSTVYKLAATNYLELRVFQTNTSGGSNNLTAALNYSPEISATWVGLG